MTPSEDIKGLLLEARRLLRAELMPALDGHHRFEAAMIAGALAIGARAIEQAPTTRAAEHARLAAFYNDPEASREALLARLCHDIRSGRLDPPARAAEVRSLLEARTRDRLAISGG